MAEWYATVSNAGWKTLAEVKMTFNSADYVSGGKVIFDIGGNNYRLVVRVSYTFKQILVKFVGTHGDYDKIDPETV